MSVVTYERLAKANFWYGNSQPPIDYTVIEATEVYTLHYKITNQQQLYNIAQPLSDDELLLVTSRSHYRRPNNFDWNGNVFSINGELKRQFLLGDGIQNIQTTQNREWGKLCSYKFHDMSRIMWKSLFVELSMIPSVNKNLDSGAECFDTA